MENHNHNITQEKELSTIYTCTMHPEIRQDKPGMCPKCGMRLVKKVPEENHDAHAGHVMI